MTPASSHQIAPKKAKKSDVVVVFSRNDLIG